MIYTPGIVIAFFLAVLLISKKGRSEADLILATWLFIISAHLLLFYFYFTGKSYEIPYVLGIDIPFPLLHGPFLYLYTSSLTQQNYKKRLRFFHFVPAILAYLIVFKFFLLTNEQKIVVYQNKGLGFETNMSIIFLAIVSSGISYVVLSLRILNIHKKNIANQFSFTEKINLTWMSYLIWGIGIIWTFVIFGNDEAIFSIVVFYVLFIGFFGIKQVGIFTNQNSFDERFISEKTIEADLQANIEDKIITTDTLIEGLVLKSVPDELNNNSKRIKYQKSGLNDQVSALIHKELSQLMQVDKIFKNAELTLLDLAQRLNVHPNSLSQVINTLESKNFYDYINEKRIEEFKNIILLPENRKFTLLALAHECGFNSKTSFNRNFKKNTGVSPSDYLKSIHVEIKE